MKQYAIVKDTTTKSAFGVVVLHNDLPVFYGATEKGKEWANWANNTHSKSLETGLPAGIVIGEFCPIIGDAQQIIENIINGAKEDSMPTNKFSLAESVSLNAQSATPAVRDAQLRSFDLDNRQYAIGFKALAFRSSTKVSTLMAEARSKGLGFSINKGNFSTLNPSSDNNVLQNNITNIYGKSIQRRVGKDITETKQLNANTIKQSKINFKGLGPKVGERLSGGLRSAPAGMSFIDVTGVMDADTDGIVFEGKPGLERPIIPRFLLPTDIAKKLNGLVQGDATQLEKRRRMDGSNIGIDESRLRELLGADAPKLEASNAIPSRRNLDTMFSPESANKIRDGLGKRRQSLMERRGLRSQQSEYDVADVKLLTDGELSSLLQQAAKDTEKFFGDKAPDLTIGISTNKTDENRLVNGMLAYRALAQYAGRQDIANILKEAVRRELDDSVLANNDFERASMVQSEMLKLLKQTGRLNDTDPFKILTGKSKEELASVLPRKGQAVSSSAGWRTPERLKMEKSIADALAYADDFNKDQAWFIEDDPYRRGLTIEPRSDTAIAVVDALGTEFVDVEKLPRGLEGEYNIGLGLDRMSNDDINMLVDSLKKIGYEGFPENPLPPNQNKPHRPNKNLTGIRSMTWSKNNAGKPSKFDKNSTVVESLNLGDLQLDIVKDNNGEFTVIGRELDDSGKWNAFDDMEISPQPSLLDIKDSVSEYVNGPGADSPDFAEYDDMSSGLRSAVSNPYTTWNDEFPQGDATKFEQAKPGKPVRLSSAGDQYLYAVINANHGREGGKNISIDAAKYDSQADEYVSIPFKKFTTEEEAKGAWEKYVGTAPGLRSTTAHLYTERAPFYITMDERSDLLKELNKLYKSSEDQGILNDNNFGQLVADITTYPYIRPGSTQSKNYGWLRGEVEIANERDGSYSSLLKFLQGTEDESSDSYYLMSNGGDYGRYLSEDYLANESKGAADRRSSRIDAILSGTRYGGGDDIVEVGVTPEQRADVVKSLRTFLSEGNLYNPDGGRNFDPNHSGNYALSPDDLNEVQATLNAFESADGYDSVEMSHFAADRIASVLEENGGATSSSVENTQRLFADIAKAGQDGEKTFITPAMENELGNHPLGLRSVSKSGQALEAMQIINNGGMKSKTTTRRKPDTSLGNEKSYTMGAWRGAAKRKGWSWANTDDMSGVATPDEQKWIASWMDRNPTIKWGMGVNAAQVADDIRSGNFPAEGQWGYWGAGDEAKAWGNLRRTMSDWSGLRDEWGPPSQDSIAGRRLAEDIALDRHAGMNLDAVGRKYGLDRADVRVREASAMSDPNFVRTTAQMRVDELSQSTFDKLSKLLGPRRARDFFDDPQSGHPDLSAQEYKRASELYKPLGDAVQAARDSFMNTGRAKKLREAGLRSSTRSINWDKPDEDWGDGAGGGVTSWTNPDGGFYQISHWEGGGNDPGYSIAQVYDASREKVAESKKFRWMSDDAKKFLQDYHESTTSGNAGMRSRAMSTDDRQKIYDSIVDATGYDSEFGSDKGIREVVDVVDNRWKKATPQERKNYIASEGNATAGALALAKEEGLLDSYDLGNPLDSLTPNQRLGMRSRTVVPYPQSNFRKPENSLTPVEDALKRHAALKAARGEKLTSAEKKLLELHNAEVAAKIDDIFDDPKRAAQIIGEKREAKLKGSVAARSYQAAVDRSAQRRGEGVRSKVKIAGRDKFNETDGKLWESLSPEDKATVKERATLREEKLFNDLKKRNPRWWGARQRAAEKDGEPTNLVNGSWLAELSLKADNLWDDPDFTEEQKIEYQKMTDDLKAFFQMRRSDDYQMLEHLHPESRRWLFNDAGRKDGKKTSVSSGSKIFKDVSSAFGQFGGDYNEENIPTRTQVGANKSSLFQKIDNWKREMAGKILYPDPERARRKELRKARKLGGNLGASSTKERTPLSEAQRKLRRRKRDKMMKKQGTRPNEAITKAHEKNYVKGQIAFVDADGKVTTSPNLMDTLSTAMENRNAQKGIVSSSNKTLMRAIRNIEMAQLWDGAGYNGTPTLINAEEFERLRQAGWTPIVRGHGGEVYADDWLTDPVRFVPGQGGEAAGEGEYWARTNNDEGAGWYSYMGRDNYSGTVALMPPTMRRIKQSDLKKIQEQHKPLSKAIQAFDSGLTEGERGKMDASDYVDELIASVRKSLGADFDSTMATPTGQLTQQLLNSIKTAKGGDKTKLLNALEFLNSLSKRNFANTYAPLLGYDSIIVPGDGRELIHNRTALVAYGQTTKAQEALDLAKGKTIKPGSVEQ